MGGPVVFSLLREVKLPRQDRLVDDQRYFFISIQMLLKSLDHSLAKKMPRVCFCSLPVAAGYSFHLSASVLVD